MKKRVAIIFGTRPEAVKLCPVVLAMRRHPVLCPHVCVTGQHRELLDQVTQAFGVVPDVDLNLMRPAQTLGGLTSLAVAAIDGYLNDNRPDMVLVQGDTTTVLCAALCAFYHKIPVGHVEAGLRSGDRYSPFPEEMNRIVATRLADLHFAPTETSRQNLLREGVPEVRIIVTGNPVIDALLIARERLQTDAPVAIPGLPPRLLSEHSGPPLVLITGHRRESFGRGFANICQALAELAQRYPETHFVYPVHLNPNVREPVHGTLGRRPNLHLIEPLGYLPFVALMSRASLVLTDSGGIQEEAPTLGKPVLVMRDTTERPEAIEAGTAKLVGTDCQSIVANVAALLDDERARDAMVRAVNPYGDGKASDRILAACERFLSSCAPAPSPPNP